MKIDLHEIPIIEIAEGYRDLGQGGVYGYGGRLNIRPPFQREFVYDEAQRDEVIRSIRHNFPLNVMYWVVNEGGMYEMLDGQQRTISICRYMNNDFAVDGKMYANLLPDEKEQFDSYPLMIYFCEGRDSEKYDWFKIVNMVGVKLTDQELRNAVYPGPWLSNAKAIFSSREGQAYKLASMYLSGDPKRQDYLETAIRWISEHEGMKGKADDVIRGYMAMHQHDKDCGEMWQYFQNVITWINRIFTNYRKEMKGINWGSYYNRYKDAKLFAEDVEAEILRLIDDDDVTSIAGIYEYILDGKEKHLSLRNFRPKDKRTAYERQRGLCVICGEHFDFADMEADHITPWSEGGHTTPENCQLLCRDCNRKKGKK